MLWSKFVQYSHQNVKNFIPKSAKSYSFTMKVECTKGYKGFGSFHSENIDRLLSINDKPQLPFELPKSCSTSQIDLDNNDEVKKHFMISKKWTFINHGAFGGALRCGFEVAESWRKFTEEQPLRFHDRILIPHLTYSVKALAKFINANPENLVLLQNATYGLNVAIRNLVDHVQLKHQSHHNRIPNVVYFDTAYGSVKTMIKEYTENHRKNQLFSILNTNGPCITSSCDDSKKNKNYNSIELPTPAPEVMSFLHEDETPNFWIQALNDYIKDQNYKVQNDILVLDHITSNTAIKVPIESIAKVAKAHGFYVIVDGAHGLLSQDLDMQLLKTVGVDIYISNCHKWFSSPRGSAYLWCSDRIRKSVDDEDGIKIMKPLIVSHGYNDGYLSSFIWDGARDYTSQLVIPIVIQFWTERIGVEKARVYNRNLLREAMKLLLYNWHDVFSLHSVSQELIPYISPQDEIKSPMILIMLPTYTSNKSKYQSSACSTSDASIDTISSKRPNKDNGGENNLTIMKSCSNARTSNSCTIRGVVHEVRVTSVHAKIIQDYLYSRHIEVPVKCIHNRLYVRISCHIYNTISDYEHLSRVVLDCPKNILD